MTEAKIIETLTALKRELLEWDLKLMEDRFWASRYKGSDGHREDLRWQIAVVEEALGLVRELSQVERDRKDVIADMEGEGSK